MILISVFLIGMLVFDRLSGIEPVHQPMKEIERRPGSNLYGFWIGGDSHLVISNGGGGKVFSHREIKQGAIEEEMNTFTISSGKEGSYSAQFKESGKKFIIGVNKDKRELTVEMDGVKKVYTVTDVTPDEYIARSSPKGIPDFVEGEDISAIDWDRKAISFNGMIGNEGKSGVIGADMRSVGINQKWMWHLWGPNPSFTALTVVGVQKETATPRQVITTGWTIELGGPNNGADAHAPLSVHIPEPGEWAFLLYTNGELFDTVVLDIRE